MEFKLSGNLVDLHQRETYPASVSVVDGVIASIERLDESDLTPDANFIMPGFVDSHIHIESSMLLPGEFARTAVIHGTVATVSDPHEIANVCGIAGVELMLENGGQSDFNFCFGAPACVPATEFETAGARLDANAVAKLLADPRIGYLSEVMDFPGVIARAPEVMKKIRAAIAVGKPVDGHAPGLRGEEAKQYFAAGITTDHECFTLEEALDKLAVGCKIAIREGSAARNFEALESLIDTHPDQCMFCSDDKHPDELLLGHIDRLAARAVAAGRDAMNVMRVACLNPVEHYGLEVGMLRVGDRADFITVKDLVSFQVTGTWLNGKKVAENGTSNLSVPTPQTLNQFTASPINEEQLHVPATSRSMRVIEAIDGQLITNCLARECRNEDGLAVIDAAEDILKLVVVNRYSPAPVAVSFVTGFGIRTGAIASSVAHDSHNVVAVGASDADLVAAINGVISSQGGLAVSCDGTTDTLPLPVAGLMSTESCEQVGESYSKLDRRVKEELGSTLRAPFMTLSFMALPVIPSLKLTDKGLFDVDRFEMTTLFND